MATSKNVFFFSAQTGAPERRMCSHAPSAACTTENQKCMKTLIFNRNNPHEKNKIKIKIKIK